MDLLKAWMPSGWLNSGSQQESQDRQKPWSQQDLGGYQDPWRDEDPWGYQESQDQLGDSSSANNVVLAESQAPRDEGGPLNLQDHDQQVLLSDHEYPDGQQPQNHEQHRNQSRSHDQLGTTDSAEGSCLPDGQQFQRQQQSLAHGGTQDPGDASCAGGNCCSPDGQHAHDQQESWSHAESQDCLGDADDNIGLQEGQQPQDEQELGSHRKSQDQPGDPPSADDDGRPVPVVAAVEGQAREPDGLPGTHIPVTEYQARDHIAEIRDQKMRSYQSGIAEDFKNALDV